MFGVPEALLSDRGANLLSHLMLDICRLLGIEKLNTTAYHPECDGMVERFNRTLKSMLRKRAAQFGNQWDKHLPALLWAYRNAPHDATGEKPSFLLFGWDCRSPTEAALLPASDSGPTAIEDYREELVLTLSSARETALENIRKAQKRYKKSYDRKSDDFSYRVGDWVLIRFPSEETGRLRKLSRPWHGPYRVTSCNETNVTAVKVYFPREDPIQVHQLRVKPCPPGFTAGFYWYGAKRRGPGRPPRWVQDVLSGHESSDPRANETVPAHESQQVPPALDGASQSLDVLPDGETDAGTQQPDELTVDDAPPDGETADALDRHLEDDRSTPTEEYTTEPLTDEYTEVSPDISYTLPRDSDAAHRDRQSVPRPQTTSRKEHTRIGYSLRRERQPPDRLM
jgi:hypothetical protein